MEERTPNQSAGNSQATANPVCALNNGDPLYLQPSDHPGMVISATTLTRNNYTTWSQWMRVALGAKVKLGFITGGCEMPTVESGLRDQWIRVNFMVTSWILNCVSKDIADGFISVENSRVLWKELKERYGHY